MSSSSLKDEFDEFDELEDEDEEPGFSGLMVLLMGGLMLGAMVAVVWVAYSHGVKMGQDGDPPVVAADPSPARVDRPQDDDSGPARAVYDDPADPADETVVVAEVPDEPVGRPAAENPLLGVARGVEGVAAGNADDPVADRIASLADATGPTGSTPSTAPAATAPATQVLPTPGTAPKAAPGGVSTGVTPPQPAASGSAASVPAAGPLSGTHVVQVAALKSREEADSAWAAMSRKLGTYVDGKSPHVLPPAGAGDVYYRLRVGPFANKDVAATYCEGLKERGQGCMVRPN